MASFLHHGILLALFLVAIFVLALLGKLPSIDQFRQFAAVVDTRGGNITVLLTLTIMFFCVGVGLLYYLVGLVEDKVFNVQEAMIIEGTVTYASGWALGALSTKLNSNGQKPGNGEEKK
jgi:hypothetical protein